MNQILRASSYAQMPWKNGQGFTTQIDIHPAQSSIAEMNFDYRLSSAKISAPGPFSRFPGYDRLLCVIEGEALRINGYRHESFDPFAFRGEEEIYAALYGAEVVDLGLIYRRDKFRAQMHVQTLAEGTPLCISARRGFIFCAEGHFQVEGSQLEKGDTLKFEDASGLELTSSQKSKIVLVELNSISS